jgi:hypothetical protein
MIVLTVKKNSMKLSIKTFSTACALCLFLSTSFTAKAQDEAVSFNVGADVVSSYVWRGVPQEATKGTPNIQPFVSGTAGSFTLGVWGSSSFLGNVKEFDIYASYAFGSILSVTLTDYNWIFGQKYFNYDSSTDHVFEGTLSYAGIESFPLSAVINTMFYGADKQADGDQAYSTYLELGYPLSPSAKVFAGASLMESLNYVTTGFGVTNVGVKISKSIGITESFSLPVYGIAGFNPTSNNAYLVAGVTF